MNPGQRDAHFGLLFITSRPDLYGGPGEGNTYSLDGACPQCGTGALRIGPLIVSGSPPRKAGVFETLDGQVLVSEEIAERLRSACVRCLGPVLDKKSGKPLPFAELVPEATLPPFSGSSTGYERSGKCPACRRDGYFNIPHTPTILCYKDLNPALLEKDFLCTYERWGLSRLRTPFEDSVFASPMYLASERLVQLLREAGARGFRTEAVVLED